MIDGDLFGRLSILQVAIILGYFVLLICVAIAFRRLNQDGDDYFRSGCQGTWWLVGMSTFMASFSAYTFTGLAGASYRAGLSATTTFLANIIGFALNALFLAAWLRQLRVTTAPEVIRDRFGEWTEQVYSWIGNLVGLIYSALTLYTVSIFTATVFEVDIQWVIVSIGLTVLIYSWVGGRWAVMGADFVQALILIPVTCLLAVLCYELVGGFEGLFSKVAQQGLWNDFKPIKEPRVDYNYNFTLPWIIASMAGLMMDRLSLNAAPRYFSARDGKEASKSAWLVTGLMVLGTVVFFFPPMVARVMFSAEVETSNLAQPSESAYAIASMKLLPEGLMGLMVVSIFAATMSTMDAGLNSFAAVFAKNIYPLWCKLLHKKPATGKKLLRLGEFFTLCSGVVIIVIALYFAALKGKGAFELMLDLGALLVTPMAVPLVLGLFTRKAPGCAALFAIGFGLAVSTYGYYANWIYDLRVFSTMAASALGYFFAYRMRHLDSAETPLKIRDFYERMHRPVCFEKEVGTASAEGFQAQVLGYFSMATGTAISVLIFFEPSNGINGKLGIAAIVGLQFFVGLLLLLRARKLRSPKPDPFHIKD